MSKRILVVEDQPDSRRIIRDMLAGTDYEITEAENGEEALAAIASQRPDLILMDIQLPIMDGYTATKQIKADPALRSIPIIAVTSYALPRRRKEGSGGGVRRLRDQTLQPTSITGENSAILVVSLALIAAVMSPLGTRHTCGRTQLL
jgi:two-component system, cell cycle response regulator DivK